MVNLDRYRFERSMLEGRQENVAGIDGRMPGSRIPKHKHLNLAAGQTSKKVKEKGCSW